MENIDAYILCEVFIRMPNSYLHNVHAHKRISQLVLTQISVRQAFVQICAHIATEPTNEMIVPVNEHIKDYHHHYC